MLYIASAVVISDNNGKCDGADSIELCLRQGYISGSADTFAILEKPGYI
jgi:hypothetical protein